MAATLESVSHLRGVFSEPRRAMTYYFRASDGRALTVAWTGETWRCVHWRTGQPIEAKDEQHAEDMRDAEAQAAALWDAANPPRMQLVA